MYWSKVHVWGALPTHDFWAHAVTLADNVTWLFGGYDDKGCFKDMWCFNIVACAPCTVNRPLLTESLADIIICSRDDAMDAFEMRGSLPAP